MAILIYFVVFVAVFLIINALASYFFQSWNRWQTKRIQEVADKLDESFIFMEKRRILLLTFSPFIFAGLGFLLLGNLLGAGIGFFLGVLFPALVAKMARSKRIGQFRGQLVDMLMIFSSSLKGGSSFTQALETICSEMPPPVSQEIGLVLKENRLGVTMEDSLESLRRRMPVDELNLLVSAILVARETGGELPKLFARLTETIRSNIRLKEKIATLTLQGRLQGVIMAILPVVFTIFIYRQNPEHFNIMLETEIGKKLIVLAVILQIVGIFVIKKISTLKI